MQNQPIDERAFYRGVLVLLALTGFVGLAASLLHYLEPEPELMDLVIPPLVTVANFILAVWLRLRPKSLLQVVYSAFAVGIVALALPAWYYSLLANNSTDVLLIDIFPPISSFMIILIVVVMVMLPPRRAFLVVVIAWLSSALPILGYLLLHKDELWAPRGQEMFISYGFAIVLLMVLLPFQHRARLQIARLRNDNDYMHDLAERDELTRQYNRWGGQRLLDDFMQSNAAGSIIMLDIDHFKPINDTHGHMVGDSVLKQFAERISSALRSDGYVIRWGGEEFLVVIRDIADQDVRIVAERLRKAINSEPFPSAGKMTASGGATSRRDDDTLDSLISRADKALYQAKQNGRDQVFCD